MASTEPAQDWLPSGFPPRSFPAGPPATPAAPSPGGGPPPPAGRGRWLAAIAGLVALLLLAGGLFAATRGGDDDAQLTSGSSSSAPDTSVPTFDSTTIITAVAAATTAPSIDPVTTVTVPASTVPPSTATAGLLEINPGTLTLPKTDALAGATRGTLTLRNAGGSPLTYTVQSSVAALTVAPARGNLGPGATQAMTVTLDASRIPTEGPFTGNLSFGGSGGARTIQVLATTGRPPEIVDNVGEPCPAPTITCSRQIRLGSPTPGEPSPSPCNTPWAYAVTITDQSQVVTARAIARRGIANADALLQQAAGTDIFVSNSFSALPAGTVLRFALEAVDVHGFSRRLPEQTISCP